MTTWKPGSFRVFRLGNLFKLRGLFSDPRGGSFHGRNSAAEHIQRVGGKPDAIRAIQDL
jgi:hypothetical protein